MNLPRGDEDRSRFEVSSATKTHEVSGKGTVTTSLSLYSARMTYDRFADFVENRMRTSRVYQPVMLLALLRGGGEAEPSGESRIARPTAWAAPDAIRRRTSG